ncbi:MAG: hypothetical protein M1499_05350 [Firmicutes bacterium]|jgi:hypothetical protein|nr:hypothetical protein [Bacillota bacterium]
MRKQLKTLNGQRLRFIGVFERFGTKRGWHGHEDRTILLKDVRRENAPDGIVTDHLWFTCGKTFDRLHLRPGDVVAFNARVTTYEKGYHGRRAEETGEAWSALDYRLERPTQAVKIAEDALHASNSADT